MALRFKPGDRFPDHALPDDAGYTRPISEVAGGQPLVLAFYRGPW